MCEQTQAADSVANLHPGKVGYQAAALGSSEVPRRSACSSRWFLWSLPCSWLSFVTAIRWVVTDRLRGTRSVKREGEGLVAGRQIRVDETVDGACLGRLAEPCPGTVLSFAVGDVEAPLEAAEKARCCGAGYGDVGGPVAAFADVTACWSAAMRSVR